MKAYYKIAIATILIITGIVVYDYLNQPYSGPSHLDDPIQVAIDEESVSYIDDDGNIINISLFASYQGFFGVQGVKRYITDGAASVSPRDFILSWGDLNQVDVDKDISYSQSGRWYYYRYSPESTVSGDYIGTHSANTHIIPENEEIEKLIKKVRENDLIYMEGFLADVHFQNGDWSSSETRTDTGNGACEIFYVTHIEIY